MDRSSLNRSRVTAPSAEFSGTSERRTHQCRTLGPAKRKLRTECPQTNHLTWRQDEICPTSKPSDIAVGKYSMTTGALISPNLISGVRGSELFAKTTTPTLTPTPKPVAKEFNHGALPTLFGRIALPVHSLWIMKNGAVKGIVNLATLATSWNIVGVGDLTATVTPTVFGRIPVEHMASG